jgi:hypothetical protein
MLEGGDAPCWCTTLPPVVPVPSDTEQPSPGCWCPACLRQHIALQLDAPSGTA